MIDASTAITIAVGIAASVGGFVGGKQVSRVQGEALSAQSNAIDALRTRLDLLQGIVDTIPSLQEEIRILRELATQRARVEEVIEIVTRIEEKVNEASEQPGVVRE